nr:MAG: DNA pilot protein [Microvirus sp.]
MVWQAIAGIGSSLLGGLFGSSGAKKQNAAQIQMAREQMDFQREMSNTAHQREVTDLKAAGINPILSAKLGGASSPSGAMPNIVNEMAPLENSARSMGEKLYNYNVQKEQVSNMKLQNNLLQEQVKAAQISNARQGLLTPAYESGGKIIDKIVGAVSPWLEGTTEKGLGQTSDIVQEVMDAANSPTGVLPAVPSAYKLAEEYSKYTKGSGAGKYYRGEEKNLLRSIFNSTREHVAENERIKREKTSDGYRQRYELTPERLKAYGIKHLDDIRRRAGR